MSVVYLLQPRLVCARELQALRLKRQIVHLYGSLPSSRAVRALSSCSGRA
jgi:hypothetical protein